MRGEKRMNEQHRKYKKEEGRTEGRREGRRGSWWSVAHWTQHMHLKYFPFMSCLSVSIG